MRRYLPWVVLAILTLTACDALPAQMSAEERAHPRESLQTFFALLHDEHYVQAVRLYGGDYRVLQDNNPDIAPDRYDSLLERACKQNGYQCLRVRAIVEEIPMSATEINFIVEFTAEDGRLFVRGPCCGATETEQPPGSRFKYTVRKVRDEFLVQELPPYVP